MPNITARRRRVFQAMLPICLTQLSKIHHEPIPLTIKSSQQIQKTPHRHSKQLLRHPHELHHSTYLKSTTSMAFSGKLRNAITQYWNWGTLTNAREIRSTCTEHCEGGNLGHKNGTKAPKRSRKIAWKWQKRPIARNRRDHEQTHRSSTQCRWRMWSSKDRHPKLKCKAWRKWEKRAPHAK